MKPTNDSYNLHDYQSKANVGLQSKQTNLQKVKTKKKKQKQKQSKTQKTKKMNNTHTTKNLGVSLGVRGG